MQTVDDVVQQFTNETEEFIFSDGRKFIYQYNKLCNAQVSLATEFLTWCLQCTNKIPNDFNILIESKYTFWRERIISFLLLEVIDGKIQKFNLDDCAYIEEELLNTTTDAGDGSRDLYVKITKIIEGFFLKRGNSKMLLTFSYRTSPQKLTEKEQSITMITAMGEMLNALKDISKNKDLINIFTTKKKLKKGSTGQ